MGARLNIKFVAGEWVINGTVDVVWVGTKIECDKRELQSSKVDDVGEKAIDWLNWQANEDDGERQLLIGDVAVDNFVG